MSRLLAIPAGPRAKWVVVGAWLVIAAATIVLGLPSKFDDAQRNESTSFLPGDAESTDALRVTKRLQDGEQAPGVIVYHRDGGLTAADRAQITTDLQRLNRVTRRFENTTAFGNPGGPDAGRSFLLSRDATSALISNQIRGTGEHGDILDPVKAYRDLVSRDGALQVKVTGPAGISADAIEVFEGLDGTLLLSAGLLVFFLLILIYRSPIFWLLPLLAVGFAELTGRGLGWVLTEIGVTVNGQSAGILSVLVLGAGTDYALLLVARYREELRRHEDRHEAMARALRSAGPAIVASGATVAAVMLSLLLAKVNGTAGLGPIAALGIVLAVIAQMTFLPALLTIVGRKPFWPFVPRVGAEGADATHGFWRRLGERVARRPVLVATASTAVLVAMGLGLLNFSTGLTQDSSFRGEVESVQGQELIAGSFPRGQSAPTDIVVRDAAKAQAVAAAAAKVEGVTTVSSRPVASGDGDLLLAATLSEDPYSTRAFEVVPRLRRAVRAVAPGTLVGGATAVEYDLRQATTSDTKLLVPIALAVVFVILALLLRSLLAPVLLILTVVLSFAAALGVGAVVFDVIFGFPGSDPSLPLFAFIFLVALGVDYNIFLMARVREEARAHGTRQGMLRSLAVTGGVITSAGIVLAGTFAALAVLPLVFFTEIGFVVAFGVLLDTFLVRSVLVPALAFIAGPRIWWPSTLAASIDRRRPVGPPPQERRAA